MIKINKSPILTSKNYGVNYFEIDEGVFNFEKNQPVNVSVKNYPNQTKISQCKITKSLIGDELNKQLQNDSNFCKVFEIDKDTQNPIEIDIANNTTLIGAINILVKDGVCVSVIIKINATQKTYDNIVINLDIAKNAQLNLSLVLDLHSNSNSFISIIGNCDTNSHLNLNMIDFGCANSVQNINVNLNNILSRFNINSIYFGGLNNKLGLNYLVSEYGKKCGCNIDVCGVLSHNAYKNFLGTIDFKKGSQQSEGSESEHCILLSDNVKSNSTPILLSAEEDVNGSHSSSVGKIDDEELFYIMSRGISKTDATKLLIKAKLAKILCSLNDENLKLEILKRIDKKID